MPEPHSLHPGQPPAARQCLAAPPGRSPCPMAPVPAAHRPPLRALPCGGGFPCAEAPHPRAQDSDGSSKAKTASAAPPRPCWVGGRLGGGPRRLQHPCMRHTHPCPPPTAGCHCALRRGACRLGGTEHPSGLFPPACWCRLAQRGQDALAGGLGTRRGLTHPQQGGQCPGPSQAPASFRCKSPRDLQFVF